MCCSSCSVCDQRGISLRPGVVALVVLEHWPSVGFSFLLKLLGRDLAVVRAMTKEVLPPALLPSQKNMQSFSDLNVPIFRLCIEIYSPVLFQLWCIQIPIPRIYKYAHRQSEYC